MTPPAMTIYSDDFYNDLDSNHCCLLDTSTGNEFSTYISEGAIFIKTRHSAEAVSYALTSISVTTVYLVLTFAAGVLRAAFALLETRTSYTT